MKSCHLIEARALHMVVSKRGQLLIDSEKSADTLVPCVGSTLLTSHMMCHSHMVESSD